MNAAIRAGSRASASPRVSIVPEVVDRMEQLRAASGGCVLLVHHAGHDSDRGRGATAVKGALQTEPGVERKGKGLLDSQVTLKRGKQKDDEEFTDITFGLHQVALNGEATEDGKPVTSIVLVPLNPVSQPQARTGQQGRVEEAAQIVDSTTRVFVALMNTDPNAIDTLTRVFSEAFPWVRFLPTEAVREFLIEFMETARASSELGTVSPIAPLVVSWKSTAEIYADPELRDQLTAPAEGDFGPVEPPKATAE
ncbi:hypothetical protein [Streptomyces sp. NPDC001508]|uniref:hypothetical protein n=1 Tax=Streptomyces sp. NPDC001508 TaxID=3154656 RepID=UPI003329154D